MRNLLVGLVRAGLAGVLGLGLGVPAAFAQAPAGDPAPPAACGQGLSGAVMDAWQGVGGEAGRLGCPTEKESASAPSPAGWASRVAVFGLNGQIVLHASGPRAGQAFVVSGCFYRLYVQFGGTGGWLGLPLEDAVNTPDGSRQAFEGGSMRYARALDDCEATPAAPAAAPAAAVAPASASDEVSLDLFEDPTTGERISLAAGGSIARAVVAGYQRLRTQARVFSQARPGAIPLKLFRDEGRALTETLASAQSEREAFRQGFAFEAGQGFIWTDPHPGAVTLKLFRDPATGRAWLTAGEDDEREAAAKGYAFARVEGYADPAP